MNSKTKIVIQVTSFILLGLLVARFILDDELTIKNSFSKIDVIFHYLIIIGFFLMSFSKKNTA